MKRFKRKKLNIDIIVGARPNLVKVASLFNEIKKNKKKFRMYVFRLIHTGQHYDSMLSNSFFNELNIPKPDYNLGVGSGTHIYQTAHIMLKYEKIIIDNPPDVCVVVGDVNSTIACSLAAKKLGIKIAHIEAGLRSGDLNMPEEINRIVTDSITDYYFTTSRMASHNLIKSGVEKKYIFFVGNTMIDTLASNLSNLRKPDLWDKNLLKKKSYFLLTLHRPSNVDKEDNLNRFINLISEFKDEKFIFPVHPRTKIKLNKISNSFKNIILTPSLSYLNFNYLLKNSKGIITDSGGITEEATFFKVPCLTMRNSTERPETIKIGTNILIGKDFNLLKSCIKKINDKKWKNSGIPEKWDGKTAKRILKVICKIK